MKIQNNKPVILEPVYTDDVKQDLSLTAICKEMIAKPIMVPLAAKTKVTLTANGQNMNEDDLAELIVRTVMSNTLMLPEETALKDLFSQSLVNFNQHTTLTLNDLFLIQSSSAAKMPEPTANLIYTPAVDVIPACRQFLAGVGSYDTMFTSLGFFARPDILGFYFATETSFEDFKTWLSAQMTTYSTLLTADDMKLFGDFQNLSLDSLTESIMLRNDTALNNHPFSFARMLIYLLMQYKTQVSDAEFGILPFSLKELIYPKNLIFVNLEQHSKASAKSIKQEWELINDALKNKINVISNTKLNRLTATQRNLQRIASTASAAYQQNAAQAMRSASFTFRQKPVKTLDMARLVTKILKKMSFVNTSMNTYRVQKFTFAKPNRRDPDDFNKQGKSTSTRFVPDLHIYIDTSGSISEQNYSDTMKALISMAKKLNIDIYFNSFSHIMSQTTKLHLNGKSPAAIYTQFQKVPKVNGGTDYEQIWHFINSSVKRTRELSIVITDFEYYAPSHFVKHPKNLYYIPCSVTPGEWSGIVQNADNFARTMLHNDAGIRSHLLL